MNVREAAKEAVQKHSNLVDAQAYVCEINFRLLPIPTFKECLVEVLLEWNSQKPVGWPEYPQRHEVLNQKEFVNYVLGEFVAPED